MDLPKRITKQDWLNITEGKTEEETAALYKDPANHCGEGTEEWVRWELEKLGRDRANSLFSREALKGLDDREAYLMGLPEAQEIKRRANEARSEWAWDAARRFGVDARYIGKGLASFEAPTKDHAKAKAAIEAMVNTPTTSAMILLFGPPGTGKTHLAVAGLHRRIYRFGEYAQGTTRSGEFVTATGIAQEVRDTYGDNETKKTERKIILRLCSVGLLVIDEVGAGLGSDHERAMLNAVVCGRYNNLLPTILISNLGLDAIKLAAGDRIMDRLKEDQGSAAIPMAWASWRGRKTV